jgi:chromosome segregation and condensation protein ScpB
MGFITMEKKGNTQILDLTEKFFDYFQVIKSELKEKITPKEEVSEQADDK